MNSFKKINHDIINCKQCPRLSKYIRKIAKDKVKRFQNEDYWGKPLPGFGDIKAELLIIGLAPAAHGGNRTGRMFTGDSSGDWLAKVLFEHNFASKSSSEKVGDGFYLKNTYITAAIRCAPPQNKPIREEFENCLPYLKNELSLLTKIKVIICLGRIAFDTCCKLLEIKQEKFSHGRIIKHKNFVIISSYHPSRQNTNTGRLSWNQWNSIFQKAKKSL
jgi:uracil-DNA glycosylase family 4